MKHEHIDAQFSRTIDRLHAIAKEMETLRDELDATRECEADGWDTLSHREQRWASESDEAVMLRQFEEASSALGDGHIYTAIEALGQKL